MTRLRNVLSALLVSVAFGPAALAAHTHVPAPSTWTLNIKETEFGGGPSVRSDIDRVLADNEQQLHWDDITVDANGNTGRTSWVGPEDGTFRPIKGFPGAKASWNTADDSELIIGPDGAETHAILTLSADGKKMILTQTFKDPKGKVYNQKLVYDRIK